MKLLPLTILAALAVTFTPSAHAAAPSIAIHNSALVSIERLAQPDASTQSSRFHFHLSTTTSCNAAQTQCVAACSTKSGQAAQNCVSDCNDIRSVCQ
jgi:hypothetical protein